MLLNRSRISAFGRRFGLIAAVAAVALLIGRLTVGTGGSGSTDAGHGHDHAGEETAEEVWTCSMHPQVRQPHPGKCPICAMDLILLDTSDDDGEEVPRLSLGARAMALMEVETSPVVRQSSAHSVRLAGRIDYDERGLHEVVMRTEGELQRLVVNHVNAPVRRGQRLADVYSPAVLAASEELLVAARSDRSGRMLEMTRRKLSLLGVSASQIDRIIESGKASDTFIVHSPAAGVVTAIEARQGDWAGRGEVIMRIADLSNVWILLEAYESDLPWIRQGQDVTLTLTGRPGETIEGTVSFVDPVVNRRTRTAGVRVQIDNADGRLKPGMLVQGELRSSLAAGSRVLDQETEATLEGASPLMIPATAALYTGRRSLVYVRVPGTERPTFEPRDILLGPRAGAWQLVIGGLEEGELVVSNGAFKIDSELQIRGRPSMMSPKEDGPDPIIRLDVPVAFSSAVGELVHAYTGIAKALSEDDPSAADAAVPAVITALESVKPLGLADEARDAWQEISTRIAAAIETLDAIDIEAGIEAQRAAFEPLSDVLDEAVSLFGAGSTGPVYRAHCPMAFDDRGAGWLQIEEDLSNPYFGASMLRCGTIDPIGPGARPRGASIDAAASAAPQGHNH